MTKMNNNLVRVPLAAAVCLLATQGAWAHPGHSGEHGFVAGMLHPLTGIDHILAMVAVGLLAARLGEKALWALPVTFISLMILGGLGALSGVHVPMVDQVIAASVVVLGVLVAISTEAARPAALLLVGAFALFHGYAHVAEKPADMRLLTYGVGFVMATSSLHLAGIGLGLAVGRVPSGAVLARIGGVGIAVCGVLIAVGLIQT